MHALIAAALVLAASPAFAGPHDHESHGHAKPARAVASVKHAPEAPSTREYRGAMERMHRGMSLPYGNDADVDFARGMIPHHQAALEMARTVLKYGRDAEIRALAEWIVFIQEQEIAQLQEWLFARGEIPSRKWVGGNMARVRMAAAHSPATAEYRDSMQRMHHAMHIAYSHDADVDFARGMIPHHQGAVEMARTQLRHGKNFELRRMAEGIIRSQLQEISLMQCWLAAKGITK